MVLREYEICPHGSLVVGSRFAMFTAAGLRSAGLIWLLTNPCASGEREVALRPALGRRDDAKVARQHGRGGDEGDNVGRRLRGARALIGTEEEDLVLHDRPADHAAELIPHETIRVALACAWIDGGKRARRVELVMAEELERVAMKRIGARLRRQADRAAGLVPVLCVLRVVVSTRNSCIASGNGNCRFTPS